MSVVYKGIIIAMEAMIFASIIALLYITADYNAAVETAANGAVEKKINISSTYVDYENEGIYGNPNGSGNLLYLSGAAVTMEILSYDGTITVQLNNTVLNNYRTETGESFFDYVKTYGMPGDIVASISNTRQYQKNCVTDNEGKLVKVEYILQ